MQISVGASIAVTAGADREDLHHHRLQLTPSHGKGKLYEMNDKARILDVHDPSLLHSILCAHESQSPLCDKVLTGSTV